MQNQNIPVSLDFEISKNNIASFKIISDNKSSQARDYDGNGTEERLVSLQLPNGKMLQNFTASQLEGKIQNYLNALLSANSKK